MLRIILFVFALFSSSISNAEIIKDDSGNKYITLGSSKDEVLEVLGTPTQVQYNGRTWWYGSSYIDFNDKEEIKEYSGGNQLKIRLLPKNKSKNNTLNTVQADSKPENSSYSFTPTSETKKTTHFSGSSSASGYGEISSTTGRAKTVHVRGYTKKDGTYVSPHYRSPPRKK